MAAGKTLTIEPGAWNPVTEDFINRALSTATLADIKLQVEAGAALFEVREDGETVAAFVLRVDDLATHSEGVVVAAGGRSEVDLTATILPYIETMFRGCKVMRIHTERCGLAKKLERQGYRVAELILTKEIHGQVIQ